MTDSTRVLVLVADDNEGLRDTTAEILKSAGYIVVEAGDGEEAIDKLRAQPFNVVLLDVRMPKRDGLWVVENMDPEPPPPGVVLASAYAFDQELQDHLGTKVLKYLRKPVPPLDLLQAVSQAAGLEDRSTSP